MANLTEALAVELVGHDAGLSAAADKGAMALHGVGNAADDVTRKSGGLMGALGGVATAAGGFVIAEGLMRLPGLLSDAAHAAAEEETGVARLAQAVNNSGGSWDTQSKDIEGVIHQREKLGFSDDSLRSSMALLTAQTDDVSEAQKRQKMAMDLARGANIPLEQASKLLGKASEENVSVLTRLGVRLEKGASLTELFGAVQEKFGGQAEAAANTAAVQWEIFQNQLGNLQEDIGGALLPVMTQLGGAATAFIDDLRESGDLESIVNGLAQAFEMVGTIAMQAFGIVRAAVSTDLFQGIVQGVRDFASAVQFGFNLVASVASALLAGDVVVAIQTLEENLDIDLGPFIGAFQTAMNFVQGVWQRLQDASATVSQVLTGDWESNASAIDPFVNAVGIGVQFVVGTVMPMLQAGVETALAAVQGFWDANGATITAIVQTTWTMIQSVITGILNVVVPFAIAEFTLISDWVQMNWPLIQGVIEGVFNVISTVINAVVPPITALITENWTTIQTVTNAAFTIVSTVIDTTLQTILGIIKIGLQVLNGDWSGAWTTLQTTTETLFRGVVTIIETVGGLVNTAVASVWQHIQDGVGAAWEGIKGAVGTKLEEVRAGIVAAATAFTQAGGALVDGIIEGFRSAGPRLQGAMGQVVNSALDNLKSVLGIASPSTLAATTIGTPLGEGVIQGFVNSLGNGSSAVAEAIKAIVTTAVKYGIDPLIALTLAKAESNLNPAIIGDSGHSVGLFQLHDQGQGAGMTVAQRQDPWVNAEHFLSQHGALFQALAGNYTGAELAARFGVKAEQPQDQTGAAYASAWRELVSILGDVSTASVAASGHVAAASQEMVQANDEAAAKAAHLEEAQTTLNDVIGKGFPQATGTSVTALQAFGAGAQRLVDDMLSGNATLYQTKVGIIQLAESTGLATGPMRDLETGVKNQDQALKTVLATVAEVNPAYASTAAGFIMGATTSEEATMNFLQLAASTQGITAAVVPADQALRTMGSYMPTVSELAVAGKLTGDQLTGTLIGLSNASGLVSSTMDVQSASTSSLNGELARIVDEIAIVDPRFQGLNDRIKAEGGITDETRGAFVNLLGVITTTPGAIDPAIAAHDALGTATQRAEGVAAESWQDILKEIRDAVREMTAAINSGVKEIISALQSINNVKVNVDTGAGVKSLGKLEDAADDARVALQKVVSSGGHGSKMQNIIGVDERQHGGWSAAGQVRLTGEAGPELDVSRGGYVLSHDEATRIAERAFSTDPSVVMAATSGEGGGKTVVYASFVNHGTLVAQDADDWLVNSLKRLDREGRIEGIEVG